MDQNILTIGLLQYDIKWHDTSYNMSRIKEIVSKKWKHADLLILPEMFYCGFSPDPEPVAQTVDGEVVGWMKKLASQYQAGIIGSVVIKENNLFYNRLIAALPSGELFHYDKRHLFRMGDENKYYTQGDEVLIFNYKGWRIRPLICYDLRFPVWSRNQNNYDLLIYVANWPSSRRNVWNILLPARAIENQSYVIGVNRIGADPSNSYAGDSGLYNYKGEKISLHSDSTEFIEFVSIDLKQQAQFRDQFSVHLDSDSFKII